MSEDLEEESNEFANNLTKLIQGCVRDAPEFVVINASDDRQRRIGPSPFESDSHKREGFSYVPLVRRCDENGEPRLMLKVEFAVSLDDQDDHLAVQHSAFGLWARPGPQRTPRPVFRIEYDRDASTKPSTPNLSLIPI